MPRWQNKRRMTAANAALIRATQKGLTVYVALNGYLKVYSRVLWRMEEDELEALLKRVQQEQRRRWQVQ